MDITILGVLNFTENPSICKENTITYKGFNNNTGRWETEEQNGAQTLPAGMRAG